jgi:hypothetical protein
MLTVGSLHTGGALSALAQTAPRSAGELLVAGPVTVNDAAVVSGVTVFSESRIKTARNGTATVKLGRLGRVDLGPDTEITLRFSDGAVGGSLLAGKVMVTVPASVGVSVMTANGVAVSDPKLASMLTVDLSCGNMRVISGRGDAKVTAGGKVEYLAAGQEVAVGTPTANGPCQAGGAANTSQTVGVSETISAGLSAKAITALIIAGVAGAVGGAVIATGGNKEPQVSPSRP